MAPRTKTLVGTAEVRDWGRANGWEVSDSGRLNSALIKEFNKAHKDKVYTPDVRSTATRRVAPAEVVAAAASPVRQGGEATKIITAGGDVPNILEMLKEATDSAGGGRKVLLAAYTLTEM